MSTDLSPASTPKAMRWAGWILSVLPVPLLIMSGMGKIQQSPEVVEGFAHLDFPLRLAIVLAVLEFGSLILYLIPQTAVLGAILLTGYLGGACATHLRIGETGKCWVPVVLGVVLWLGLFFRDSRIRALVPIRTL